MYCAHFGLHRPPFNNTPDPSFYFGTPEHDEALATLEYAAVQRKGFVLLTGEIGAGKTLIGRMFLRRIEARARTAVVAHTQLSSRQLMAALCAELEIPAPPEANNLQLADRLQTFLLEQYARDRLVVVLLDEAQNLPDESFEALRMLGNLEADDAKLIQICILGQPELRERFEQPGLRQLDQRLFRRFHLSALSREQCGDYICHRLRTAGWTGEALFTPAAIDRIFAFSKGTPRLINRICDNALLTAYGRGLRTVDADMIEEVSGARAEPASPAGRVRARPWLDVPAAARSVGQDSIALSAQGDWSPDPTTPEPAGMNCPQTQPGPSTAQPIDRDESPGSAVRGAVRPWLDATRSLADYRNNVQALVHEVAARCDALQQQFDELAGAALSPEQTEHISALRLEHARLLEEMEAQKSELLVLIDRAEERRVELESRVADLSEKTVSRERLEGLQALVDERLHGLLEQIETIGGRLTSLADEAENRGRCAREELERLIAARAEAQGQALEQLARRIEQHEKEVRAIDEEAERQLASLGTQVRQLESRCASAAELERVQSECGAAIAQVLTRIGAQAESLARLQEQLAGQDRVLTSVRGLGDEWARRFEKQVNKLRKLGFKVVKRQLSFQKTIESITDRIATSGRETEELRQRIADRKSEIDTLAGQVAGALEKLADLRERIEGQREATEQLIDKVVHQCRAVQERLDDMAAAKADAGDLARMGERQEQVTAELLSRLDRQKASMRAQFDEVLNRWQQTRDELDRLAATAAPADELAAVSLRQEQDVRRMLDALGAQRGELESLLAEVNRRCEGMAARLEALPRDVVDGARLEALRQEHAEQIRSVCERMDTGRSQIDAALRDMAERCRQALEQIEILAARAATSEDVAAVRETHARDFGAVLERLDQTEGERQRDLNEFSQRCDELANSVQALAASTTPPTSITALEESLSELRERVDADQRRRQEDLCSLINTVQQLSTRLTAVEGITPVKVELSPAGGRELSELLERARAEREELAGLAETAAAAHRELAETAGQVESSLRQWHQDVAAVDEKSGELRLSVGAAARLLKTMQRAQQILDDRINSHQWQAELARGEALAVRLERAVGQAGTASARLHGLLRELDGCRNEADDWAARCAEARQVTDGLAKLLASGKEAGQRLESELAHRKRVLNAIARNTAGLVQAIEAARQADEAMMGRLHQAGATVEIPNRSMDRPASRFERPGAYAAPDRFCQEAGLPAMR